MIEFEVSLGFNRDVNEILVIYQLNVNEIRHFVDMSWRCQ